MNQAKAGATGPQLDDRLAVYEVTSAPRIPAATGLPAVMPPAVVTSVSNVSARRDDPTPQQPMIERRAEHRHRTHLRVVASHPGREDGVEGVTVNVSSGGMCVVMGEPPVAVHQDALVEEGDSSAWVWVRVAVGAGPE